MNSVTKNVYIDKLDDTVNKYNNTCHSTIKMKPVDAKSSTYIDSSKEINNKMLNLKLVISLKGYTPNCSEEVFVIKKVKNTVLWTYVINPINVELVGTF